MSGSSSALGGRVRSLYKHRSGESTTLSSNDVGCCGAYCRTCRALIDGTCLGCRLGYDTGERDIDKARCKMKVCCITRLGTAHTCADCPDCLSCDTLQGFYGKNGYKYKRYRESMEFIRTPGYDCFLEAVRKWKGAYGKLP
jgi:hypothetical protein